MNFSKKKLTIKARVWATLDRAAKLYEEHAQGMKELRESSKETDRLIKELRESGKETDRKMQETAKQIKEVSANIGGISNSNGKFAEEYFYNSLEKKKEFAGVHFDIISDGFKRSIKMPNGNKLEDQFDIVMVNDKAVALIEVKYKANKDNVEDLVSRKMKNFRILFSDYKDFDIYLGLGSLSFDDKTVDKARECGVGLLKQVGESIEYNADWEVRAY